MTRIPTEPPLIAVAALTIALSWTVVRAVEPPVSREVTKDDLPRIPATEPDEALDTFRLAKGCRLELVAAEPLVGDPVDACFDAFGRMYVAEMHGYPFSQEPTKLNPSGGGKKDAGIIRLLEDTDGDGRMDKSTIFADGISWPTSVCCYDDGVFVLAPQYLYYFKDRDGDGRADVRREIVSGFGRDNVQSVTNGLKWGLNNRIAFAAGRNPKNLMLQGVPLYPNRLQGSDLQFNPKTLEFEIITGGQQFGHSFDDWGNRFVCSNSNHIQQVIFPLRYISRNPYLAVSGLIRSIADDGASARVFRASPPEPWRIIRQKWRAAEKGYKLVINDDGAWDFIPLDPSKPKDAVPTEYPVGYFTSATGITIYRGSAYTDEFRGNAFVGDVGGNLVHRKTLTEQGVAYVAARADAEEEFVRSTDNWFRPVNFVNAPDGTLYILDMYRETVEHPYSIPEAIKEFLYLESGDDRGRIYRIVTPDMQRIVPPRLGNMSAEDLVAQLESDNAWNRQTAQRLLWERQSRSVVEQLQALVRNSEKPRAKVHALHTLEGLNALTADAILAALQDEHPRVREHAVQLAEPFLHRGDRDGEKVLDAVLTLTDDADDRVRFQVAFSLGEASRSRALSGLKQLARDPHNGGDIRTALLSSVASTADRLCAELLDDGTFLEQSHADSLIAELCLIVGSNPDPAPALRLLDAATATEREPAVQQVILTALGEGLSRRGASLAQLLSTPTASADVRAQVQALFERAIRIADDESMPAMERAEAIGLLAFTDLETALQHLPRFLSPQMPQVLQAAAVAALANQDSDQISKHLLQGWRGFSPQIRRDVTDALMSTPGRIQQLLAAVESNTVGRSDLERDRKQLLMNHPNRAVRERSLELFGSEVNSNRARVVAEHQDVLELTGDAIRGRELFKQKCALCHRVGDVGHQVAPDLASVRNKSADDLLIAILDPNREAQPNYNTYNVLTSQGKVFSGIIAAETANTITLRQAEAKEDVILRSTIESLAATGLSLMPEGLEKDLNHQDLADVIAFVKSIKDQTGNKDQTGK